MRDNTRNDSGLLVERRLRESLAENRRLAHLTHLPIETLLGVLQTNPHMTDREARMRTILIQQAGPRD